ncbi:MAG: PQQ-binding-like beta-propeller repeat protein [Planctomycetes bacterium]|nr:PQQ-binding-like beta-propeller repeat protein [Planctomycetota bacterium]
MSSSPFLTVTRVVLASLVTLILLPYAWGRTLIIWMLAGRPEPVFAAALVIAVIVVLGLSFGVGESRTFSGRRWWVVGTVATTWVAANAVLVVLSAASLVPRSLIAAVYVPATLPVLWVAWMFFCRWQWTKRLSVLVALLPLLGLFLGLADVRGMSGDAHIEFAWRSWRKDAAGAGRTRRVSASLRAVLPAHALQPNSDRDYPQFLGPDRNAVLPGSRLARDWKTRPPRELWRGTVGPGWGAFAVVGDYAFTQEQLGDEECIVCYGVRTGQKLWVHADPVHFESSLGGPGPRATPTVHQGRVYSVGATGLLNCLDGYTGDRVWWVDILKDNNAQNIAHGVCGSPLVLDDFVIVSPTGEGGPSLVAYHRDTSERVWQGGRDRASYGSPFVTELGGVRQLLLNNSEGVAAHDPATGDVLWRFPWTNPVKTNASQPIANVGAPDHVFVSTGYDKGCALIQVDHSADGSWTVKTIWSNNRLKTKFTTAVVHGEHVYGLDDGILACRDLATGKRGWKAGRYGHGQILLAGDLLLVLAENGDVVLVEPDTRELRELGRFHTIDGKTWNNPSLAGPYLLVRNDHEAACYELPLAADAAEQ